MAKKSKGKHKHTVDKSFPPQGTVQAPSKSLPAPQGGLMDGQTMPGAPMLPGEPM